MNTYLCVYNNCGFISPQEITRDIVYDRFLITVADSDRMQSLKGRL